MSLASKTLIFGGLALAGAAAYAFYKGSRYSVEQIPYSLEKRAGAFELRSYPEIQLVSTLASDAEGDDAFMKLFRFISGANERSEKIPMTAPVFMGARSEQGREMSFAMPAAMPRGGVPAPASPAVEAKTKPAGRIAAHRFSGRGTAAQEEKAVTALKEWVRAQGLTPAGEPFVAYYDAPFVPAPLRRNEAMMPVR